MSIDRFAGLASATGLILALLIVSALGLWGPMADGPSWAGVGEFVKVLGSMATGGAAITGAYIAWRGLEKWRAETVGKKRYEIAISVLADFYEMDDILRACRNPFVLSHEMGKLEGVDDEIASNSSFAPERRLAEHKEFFARFRARKFEFAASFGKPASVLFDDIWRIRSEINWAVDGMLRNKELRGSRRPDEMELWKSWYAVAFRSANESQDVILPRLDKIISDIEEICRPVIDAELR